MRKFFYASLIAVGVTALTCVVGLEAWACYKLNNEVKRTSERVERLEEIMKKTSKNGETYYIYEVKRPKSYEEK